MNPINKSPRNYLPHLYNIIFDYLNSDHEDVLNIFNKKFIEQIN